MGLNLSVVRLVEERIEFDSIRYTGDTRFVSAHGLSDGTVLEKNYVSLGSPRDGETVWRPKNIKKYKKWVEQELPIQYQKRFLDVLDKMEDDLSLYFSEGW